MAVFSMANAIVRPRAWTERKDWQDWQHVRPNLTVRERCVLWGALLRPESHLGTVVHTPRRGTLVSMTMTPGRGASFALASSAATHPSSSRQTNDTLKAQLAAQQQGQALPALNLLEPKPPSTAAQLSRSRSARSTLIKNGRRHHLGPLDRSKALVGVAAQEAKERRRKGQETLAREQKLKQEQDARRKKNRRLKKSTARWGKWTSPIAPDRGSTGPVFWTPDPAQQRGNGY